jgi:hypothetical protein
MVKSCVHCGRMRGWKKSKPRRFDDPLDGKDEILDPQSTGNPADTVSTEEQDDFRVSLPGHSRLVLINLEEAIAEHQRKVKARDEVKKTAKTKVKNLWGAIRTVVKLGRKKNVSEVGELQLVE